MIRERNVCLNGYCHAECKNHLQRHDEWTRRKPRRVRLKQRKRSKPNAAFPRSLGFPSWRPLNRACSGKGWWRMAGHPSANEAMSPKWFEELGLASLAVRHAELQPQRRLPDAMRTSGGVRGRGREAFSRLICWGERAGQTGRQRRAWAEGGGRVDGAWGIGGSYLAGWAAGAGGWRWARTALSQAQRLSPIWR